MSESQKRVRPELSEPVRQANAAMELAAMDVLERARRFNTPIILWRDGKVVELDPFSPELDEPEGHSSAAGDK